MHEIICCARHVGPPTRACDVFEGILLVRDSHETVD